MPASQGSLEQAEADAGYVTELSEQLDELKACNMLALGCCVADIMLTADGERKA